MKVPSMEKLMKMSAAKVGAQKIVCTLKYTLSNGKTGVFQQDFTHERWNIDSAGKAHGSETTSCCDDYYGMWEGYIGPFHVVITVPKDFTGTITGTW